MIRQTPRTICIWLCVWHVCIGKHLEYNLVLGWCVILLTHCSNWKFAYESFLALLPSPYTRLFQEASQLHVLITSLCLYSTAPPHIQILTFDIGYCTIFLSEHLIPEKNLLSNPLFLYYHLL